MLHRRHRLGLRLPDCTAWRDNSARRASLLQGHISAIGVVAAICISNTLVDTSPFSTNGALVVAHAQESDRESVLRTLLIYSALIAIIGPIISWWSLSCQVWFEGAAPARRYRAYLVCPVIDQTCREQVIS